MTVIDDLEDCFGQAGAGHIIGYCQFQILMDFTQQERRIQIASYISKMLGSLGLTHSAQTLRHEAKIQQPRPIDDDISRILERSQSNQEQQQLLAQYFEIYIKRLIRQNQMAEALNVFENHLPLYVQDLQPFALLFAQSHPNHQFSNIFKQLVESTVSIPEKRLSLLKLGNQIWYLQSLGECILVVDCKSNAKILFKDKLVFQRDKLHSNLVFCLCTRADIFATGGDDTYCRVWNCKLEMIYEMSKFQNRITSICFSDTQMAVFDNGGIVHVTESIPVEKTNRNSINCYRLKSIPYNEVRYMRTGQCLIAAGFQQGKGRLDVIDLARGKYACKLTLSNKIYNIQLSKCEKIVFANLNNAEIHAYSTSKFQLRCKFTGYLQRKCLMRMTVGGRNHNLLAVSSEEGCACIYDLNKQQLLCKLKSYSGKPVNCVKWVADSLYLGCDQGYVEHWSTYSQQKLMEEESKQLKELTNGKETRPSLAPILGEANFKI